MRYEGLIQDAVATVEGVFSFLALPASEHVDEFLFGEENGRTGVSFPTGKPGVVGRLAWEGRLEEAQVGRIEERLGEMMAEFGYSDR